ncbi:PLP-dependent transferase [Lophiostoma macrostomum CBS 122681]|uniref:PLP-dependent transferase n=1 Tax=Lophiostoma macrostomum CBS 122681 TaxID=1314788 RepID=A0A6A6T653_9PLEO|nr:PLP-dependent transferase [Lophiostoma macrostomum CBS 122681]
MMTSAKSTLSARGADLATGPNMRDQSSQILGKQWHPIDNPDALVNIGTAENNLMQEDVADFVKSKDLDLQGVDFDYGEGPWGSVRLREGLAKFFNEFFQPHTNIDAADLTCMNGCSALFNMLSLTLGDPGDGIMLSMPSYVAFASDFGMVGKMKPIFVPTPPNTDAFSPEILSSYETAFQNAVRSGVRPRALMLCNPHNPLGRCYPPSTLIALLEFCNKYRIHLLADEIYAMSVYSLPSETKHAAEKERNDDPATPFTSILSLSYEDYIDPNLLHHIYGLSKDFVSGGLRIGSLYTRNTSLQRALCALSSFHWIGQIDQLIAVTMLEDAGFLASFLEKGRRALASSSRVARELLRREGIVWFGGERVNAGFFLWVDLRAWLGRKGTDEGVEDREEGGRWEAEGRLSKRMLDGGVFLTPGRGQGAEEPGWYRLVFSREEVVLREGIKRLVKVLGDVKKGSTV